MRWFYFQVSNEGCWFVCRCFTSECGLTHSAYFGKNQKCLSIAKEKECEGEITNYLVVPKKGRLANMQID
jgi:hypothetical protein